MLDIILDILRDVGVTLPILFVVYIVIEILNKKLTSSPGVLTKMNALGPVLGAGLGAIPQCGFSSAASALYAMGFIAPYTLISVFLSTSDEAIPVMIAGGDPGIVKLVLVKILVAIIAGYILKFTVFRKVELEQAPELEFGNCGCNPNPLVQAVIHTIQTAVILLISMAIIEIGMYFLGMDRLSALLLNGSIFQPAICALLGLIPGCAISVFLTELFMQGTISFGAVIAGLSTGAGFGYIILFEEIRDWKKCFFVLLITYLCAAAAGTLIQLFS